MRVFFSLLKNIFYQHRAHDDDDRCWRWVMCCAFMHHRHDRRWLFSAWNEWTFFFTRCFLLTNNYRKPIDARVINCHNIREHPIPSAARQLCEIFHFCSSLWWVVFLFYFIFFHSFARYAMRYERSRENIWEIIISFFPVISPSILIFHFVRHLMKLKNSTYARLALFSLRVCSAQWHFRLSRVAFRHEQCIKSIRHDLATVIGWRWNSDWVLGLRNT